MRPILVTPERHREVPWRNGRGTSFQVWPRGSVAGHAGFQLNLTPIAAGGPFSHYPGVDRILAVAKGGGLSFDGRDGTMKAGDAIAFPGEATMTARLHDGPVTVFNLLMRRVDWVGSLRAVRGETFELAPETGELGVVHAAAGSLRFGAAVLGEAATLIARPGDRSTFEPAVDGALALVFTLRRRP
jgi:environmental stress-induced protein Ves